MIREISEYDYGKKFKLKNSNHTFMLVDSPYGAFTDLIVDLDTGSAYEFGYVAIGIEGFTFYENTGADFIDEMNDIK